MRPCGFIQLQAPSEREYDVKSIIKGMLPNWLKQRISLARAKHLINEINTLGISKAGLDSDGTPWVELHRGLRFYGLEPSQDEQALYRLIQPKIVDIQEIHFGVALAVISRYLAPRSLPGELTFSPSAYDPIRDPLNDFGLEPSEKKTIASLFRPKEGDVIVDIGAFHGFGTMRMAEHIGSSGRLIALEANPVSLKLLRKNISANDFSNICIAPKAASNVAVSQGKFYFDGIPTGNSLRADVLENLGVTNIKEIEVPIDTGDNILRHFNIEQVNHISITINGGEPEALQGLSRTIRSSPRMTISMPGWYFRDGKRLDATLKEQLINMNFKEIRTGKLGRVIAWK